MSKPIVIQRNPGTGRYAKVPKEPSRSRWDGDYIQQTKQCNGCAALLPVEVIGDRKDIIGICNQGVAWKVVVKVEKPRKCMKV